MAGLISGERYFRAAYLCAIAPPASRPNNALTQTTPRSGWMRQRGPACLRTLRRARLSPQTRAMRPNRPAGFHRDQAGGPAFLKFAADLSAGARWVDGHRAELAWHRDFERLEIVRGPQFI